MPAGRQREREGRSTSGEGPKGGEEGGRLASAEAARARDDVGRTGEVTGDSWCGLQAGPETRRARSGATRVTRRADDEEGRVLTLDKGEGGAADVRVEATGSRRHCWRGRLGRRSRCEAAKVRRTRGLGGAEGRHRARADEGGCCAASGGTRGCCRVLSASRGWCAAKATCVGGAEGRGDLAGRCASLRRAALCVSLFSWVLDSVLHSFHSLLGLVSSRRTSQALPPRSAPRQRAPALSLARVQTLSRCPNCA